MSTTVNQLLTTFTPAPSCLSTLYVYPLGISQWAQLGPTSQSDCLPANYKTTSGFYYSPGVCPSGYTAACSSSIVLGSLTETIATCCPSDFICRTDYFGGYPWYSTLSCINGPSYTATYPVDPFSTAYQTGVTQGVNAYSVQVRWQSNDFLSSGASIAETTTVTVPATATTATTPPSGNGNSTTTTGLSTGAKIGIGIGVPIAVLSALLASFYFGRRRGGKRRAPEHTNSTGNSGITFEDFKDKPELSSQTSDGLKVRPVRTGAQELQ